MKPSRRLDARFLKAAHEAAKSGTCLRAKVGCIIAASETDFAYGFNHAPSGLDQCDEVGCLMIDGGCKRVVHAETVAMLNAARMSIPLIGATAYITLSPCRACVLAMAAAGIRRVVYSAEYRDREPIELARAAGMIVEHVPIAELSVGEYTQRASVATSRIHVPSALSSMAGDEVSGGVDYEPDD